MWFCVVYVVSFLWGDGGLLGTLFIWAMAAGTGINNRSLLSLPNKNPFYFVLEFVVVVVVLLLSCCCCLSMHKRVVFNKSRDRKRHFRNMLH